MRGSTIRSFVASFVGALPWDRVVQWPPDVFAIANLVLDATESYRFAVAPPVGDRWPPQEEWTERTRIAGREWRAAAGRDTGEAPAAVRHLWEPFMQGLDLPMRTLRDGGAPDLWKALLTLHAMADEACAGLGAIETTPQGEEFDRLAWTLFARNRSLATIGPGRIRVTPKTHFAERGISIRSFSRYLALNYEAVDVEWRRIEVELASARAAFERRGYALLLMPWPTRVRADAFRPVGGPLDNMDPSTYGFFEYDPGAPLDLVHLERAIGAAKTLGKRIDGVVLPESAIHESELGGVEDALEGAGINFLVTGMRETPHPGGFVRNTVHVGVFTGSGWERFRQAKHHRWSLDAPQLRQYGLTRSLTPSKTWWEAIDIPARTVNILDLGGGMTLAPLVCEDLARLDETADLLRRIGPSLVIAVLLDGPQLTTRWACRYSSVLADEPGSAVLTLTALGMALRSRPAGASPSRVVAMWSDATTGRHELTLEAGAECLLVSAAVGKRAVLTADGRRHEGTPTIELTGVEQVRIPASRAGRKRG